MSHSLSLNVFTLLTTNTLVVFFLESKTIKKIHTHNCEEITLTRLRQTFWCCWAGPAAFCVGTTSGSFSGKVHRAWSSSQPHSVHTQRQIHIHARERTLVHAFGADHPALRTAIFSNPVVVYHILSPAQQLDWWGLPACNKKCFNNKH